MDKKMLIVRCKTCNQKLTDTLHLKEGDPFLLISKDSIAGPSAFPMGFYSFAPTEMGDISFLDLEIPAGSIIVSHDNLHAVPFEMEDFGCCGFTGDKGLSLACNQKHEVGVMISDCTYPQFAYFNPSHVTTLQIDKSFLEITASFFDKDILTSDYFQLFSSEGAIESFRQLLAEIKRNLKIPLTHYQLDMMRRYARRIKYPTEELQELELLNA